MTKPDLMAELAEVVRLDRERCNRYPPGVDPDTAFHSAVLRMIRFLRTHHAELEAVVRKAARYDWLNAHRLDAFTRNNMHDPRIYLPVGTDIFQQDAMDTAIDQAMHNSAREG